MTRDAEGFLARWSRRKVQARVEPAGSASAGQPADAASAAKPEDAAATGREPAAPAAAAAEQREGSSSPALPSLRDVARLTRESDYAPFVAREVDPSVRNAALRKLFTDPHFNVMDGLDVYIDDYGKPDPLPAGMLRQMVQSRALGLFEDPDEIRKADDQDGTSEHIAERSRGDRRPHRNQDGRDDGPDGAGDNPAAAAPSPLTAESRTLPAERQPDEDPDLRLQPHPPAEVGRGDGDPDAGAATHPRGERRGA